VHSRFAGEVVSVAEHKPDPSDTEQTLRPLRLGDHVTKGQLLAVIWSKDVGEKKSDLVNALSKLYLDTAQLDNLRSLPKNSVAGQQVREAIRERESDVIEVDRVERTLRSWRLTEAEIKAVRAEAEKIHSGDESNDLEVDKSWAEVEVRSPFDGVVLEKNIVAGDIVDTSLDLFRIADLNVLGVIANVYEEDLPALEALPPDRRRWTVNLKSQSASKGIDGSFELIGNIVDPNQHTAAVMGWLDNRDGRLRAGQFITASVQLPASEGEVVVPDTAIIQDGGTCVVFVAGDERGGEVTRRQVALASRGQNMAYIRSEPSPDEQAKGCACLKAGERVVIAGSIELEGALENALASTDLPSVNR
jgi:membrane fusion protein, heavy metal efflux system